MGAEIAVLAALICLSAFFSGLEIALFSLGRAHVRALQDRRAPGAETVARLKSRPERLLVTILIGNNVVNIGAASMATALAIRLFGDLGVGLATGVMTFLILVFGEIFPKNLAHRWAEKFALIFARPLEIFSWAIFPLVLLLEKFSLLLTRRKGEASTSDVDHHTLLTALARLGLEEGKIGEREVRVVENAFRLERFPADKVMTPRREMVGLEADRMLDEVADEALAAPFSRFPVYRGDKDEIIGVITLRQIFEKTRNEAGSLRLADAATKPLYVPRKMSIGAVLRLFQRERTHMAIVIGEYGETAGLVTLEDVLEEMVGEIEDEADAARTSIVKLSHSRYLVDASLPLEDLRRSTGVRLPGDHHTLNGLLLDSYQNIPPAGALIRAGGHTFIVRQADARRVILAEMLVAASEETQQTGHPNRKPGRG